MASSEVTTKDQIAAILECIICTETLYKPKQLICGHMYCQDCLDRMLDFNEDGSAELPCSLRCSKKTKLDKHETTSSLVTSYPMADILDEVLNAGKENPLCQSRKECKESISYSCTTCSAKVCDKCQITHSCTNKSYINVTFNEKLQEIQPLCQQHKWFGKEVCIDCDDAFLCVYCINRDHKNHRRKSIAEFGDEVRNQFQSLIPSFDKTKDVSQNMTVKYEKALTDLERSREILVHELEVRKLKKLEEYHKMLNTQEEEMLMQFDERAEKYTAKVTSAGFLKFLDYVEVIKSKTSFELISERLTIEKKLVKLSSFPSTIPNFYSYLLPISDKEFYANPLGEMNISVDDISAVGVNPSECSVFKCVVDKTEAHPNHSQLADMANNCMTFDEKIKKNEIPHGDAIGDFDVHLKRDVKPKESLVTTYYTFEEISDVIKDGDIEKLKSCLLKTPNIVEKRNDEGGTLLMEAAWYNKPSIAKALIDDGSDVDAVDGSKSNAYHYSAYKGHQDVLNVLINRDVTNINSIDELDRTALHHASYVGHTKCVELLLSVPHIDANIQDRRKDTALHLASRHGHIECVQLLLSVPYIDVSIRDKDNQTAYHVAHNNTIKHLLEEHQRK